MKQAGLSVLGPSFFTMVNTVSICLMVVAKADMEKVRKFVSYWLEKIEMEVVDEEDYDYPKYLLRSTLCNVLCELGQFQECLRLSNLNIKEITADVY